MEIKNKKAYFNYFVEETKEAGIVLVGTEIKINNCIYNKILFWLEIIVFVLLIKVLK